MYRTAGAYPRQYYYDCLARTAFWTALAAFLVMALHLTALGCMMWRHARVPNAMWFPRIELVVCLAILPGLSYGCAGERGGAFASLICGCAWHVLAAAGGHNRTVMPQKRGAQAWLSTLVACLSRAMASVSHSCHQA